MNRPAGVTVIAVLVIINAILLILGALVAGGVVAITGLSGILGAASGPVAVGLGALGILILIDGLLHLVVGFGLWNLRLWAWWVAVIISALNLLGAVIRLLSNQPINWVSTIISLIVLVYLLIPDIRAAFGQGRAISTGL